MTETRTFARIALYGTFLGGACAIGLAHADMPAQTLKSGLARCAAIAGRDDRLACFDALAAQTPAPPALAEASGAPSAAPAPPASAAAALAPAAPPGAAPTVQAQIIERPEDFGYTPGQRAAPVKEIPSITAKVVGFLRDNTGAIVVKLDNGQAWQLDSADPLLSAGDSVTIKHAALGSFMLITPSRRTHKVRRTS